MEAVKNAVGLGKKEQEGLEPVSGQQGQGTAAEPFDQGNSQGSELGGKAPQETDPSQVTGDNSIGPADSATSSGKSDHPPAPTAESETSKASKKPGIGSPGWFKTAIPLGKRKSEAPQGQQQATAGAATGAAETAPAKKETESDLPPNHLGEAVPEGRSTDLAVADLQSKHKADTAPALAAADTNDDHVASSNDESKQELQDAVETQPKSTSDGSGVGFFSAVNPFSSSTKKTESSDAPGEDSAANSGDGAPPASELAGTKAPIREDPPDYSKAPLRPAEKIAPGGDGHGHGSNPSAIPTAGGVKLGVRASEDRHESSAGVTSTDNDSTTRSNTQANIGTGTRPNIGGNAAAGAGASASSTANVPAAAAAGADRRSSDGADTGEEHKDKRRSSVFGKVKDKLKAAKNSV